MTRHARVRAQQRGISPQVIDWLLDYGNVHHDRGGTRRVYFDKKTRRRIRRDIDATLLRRHEHGLDAYAVLGADGHLITVGYRYRRFRH